MRRAVDRRDERITTLQRRLDLLTDSIRGTRDPARGTMGTDPMRGTKGAHAPQPVRSAGASGGGKPDGTVTTPAAEITDELWPAAPPANPPAAPDAPAERSAKELYRFYIQELGFDDTWISVLAGTGEY